MNFNMDEIPTRDAAIKICSLLLAQICTAKRNAMLSFTTTGCVVQTLFELHTL
jgi:hypothetical protein